MTGKKGVLDLSLTCQTPKPSPPSPPSPQTKVDLDSRNLPRQNLPKSSSRLKGSSAKSLPTYKPRESLALSPLERKIHLPIQYRTKWVRFFKFLSRVTDEAAKALKKVSEEPPQYTSASLSSPSLLTSLIVSSQDIKSPCLVQDRNCRINISPA